ncbi:MAG: TolC family protein [Deltaproteobacteria bacterium]|nr:TolC family protein [Deltaproteobacteria bacterium]
MYDDKEVLLVKPWKTRALARLYLFPKSTHLQCDSRRSTGDEARGGERSGCSFTCASRNRAETNGAKQGRTQCYESERPRRRWIEVFAILFLLIWSSRGSGEEISEKLETLHAGTPTLTLPHQGGGNNFSESIKLEDLIQIALEKNPDVIAAREEWAAAKKRVWIDTGLSDPTAGYDIMGAMRETRVGPEKHRFMVEQEIPFPWKLYEKGKMASEGAKAAHARYRAVERDVITSIKRFYYDLYFTDASIAVVEKVKEIMKRIERVAAARYASLTGGQRDVVKAQIEVAVSIEKIYTLQQMRESIVAMLNALLDQPPLTSIGRAVEPEKPVLKTPLSELIDLALQNRQEIQEMEALVEKSRHAKRLAKWSYIPDLKAGFEYTWVDSGTTSDPMDGRDQWMFPLRITIPLWQNRIIPEIQEARRNLLATEARLARAKNQTYFEVRDAYSKLDASLKMATLYETSVIPQAKIALSSDQAGYEAGKEEFINLLDSERIFLNAQLSYVQFVTEALKNNADLVRSTGLDLGVPRK